MPQTCHLQTCELSDRAVSVPRIHYKLLPLNAVLRKIQSICHQAQTTIDPLHAAGFVILIALDQRSDVLVFGQRLDDLSRSTCAQKFRPLLRRKKSFVRDAQSSTNNL